MAEVALFCPPLAVICPGCLVETTIVSTTAIPAVTERTEPARHSESYYECPACHVQSRVRPGVPIEPSEPRLGLATTRELLKEVAIRMRDTQNSNNGRRLGILCAEAIENLAPGVLDYSSR